MRGSGISRSLPVFRPIQNAISDRGSSFCSAPCTNNKDGNIPLAREVTEDGCALPVAEDDGEIDMSFSMPNLCSSLDLKACCVQLILAIVSCYCVQTHK